MEKKIYVKESKHKARLKEVFGINDDDDDDDDDVEEEEEEEMEHTYTHIHTHTHVAFLPNSPVSLLTPVRTLK